MALWMVRVRLAQLASLPAGAGRFAVESDLFRWIKELRSGTSPEARQALSELAQSALVPDAKPAAGRLGCHWRMPMGPRVSPRRPAPQMVRAADRAAALGAGRPGRRLSAARRRFPVSGRPVSRSRLGLSRAADDPAAGPLACQGRHAPLPARGRALALGLPGASTGILHGGARGSSSATFQPTLDQ